jgi:hypothetical protein
VVFGKERGVKQFWREESKMVEVEEEKKRREEPRCV